MKQIVRVLEGAIEANVVPGAVALVRHQGEVVFHEAVGWAELTPLQRPMHRDTLFDLASLTKPLVGAAVVLAQVDRGIFSLDEEVTGLLPELDRLHGQGVTFRRLLSHTAGLSGWRPLYATGQGSKEVLAAINDLDLASAPGTRFEYSDLSFITLGLATERAAGQPLARLAAELLFDPLDLHNTGYRPEGSPEDFAVTEEGNVFEKRMADWAGFEFDGWRTGFHPGEVNDGNAHYALSGVSAHAGLFSNAEDVGVLGEMWRGLGSWGNTRVLSTAAAELATHEQTDGAGRGLAWDLMKAGGPTLEQLTRPEAGLFPPKESPWSPRPSGELFSSAAYGHTGFTGTSIWVDPLLELVAVLLTNATHPQVDVNKPLNALRARFHNAAVAGVQA